MTKYLKGTLQNILDYTDANKNKYAPKLNSVGKGSG